MAIGETILQNEILQKFILPFVLIWFITFAILQKTKLLGESKQIDSIVSLVIGLIFVGAIFPKLVVSNLILFLTIAIIVVFVGLILWGFVSGSELKTGIFGEGKGLKWTAGIVIVVAVIIAVLWAAGVENTIFDFFFRNSWSGEFWTNFIFVVVIVAAVALMLKTGAKS
ncbi:MAG: hypothetical protein PVJ67_05405 [Candidatus Pacearchaeota archaeon]|jgi:hypothetical protein